mmetsp:Transcript_51523/g.112176  ORF Transcript_51523/g.112176 Transcript_51523/m.112176 type:complete len:117 (+) Transcript_51523:89-439(+)
MLQELFAEHGADEAVQISISSEQGVEMKPQEVGDVEMEPRRAFPELQETAEPLSTTSPKMSQVEADRDSLAQSQCKAAWLVHLGPVRCHRAAASLRRGPWQELRAAAEDVQIASET